MAHQTHSPHAADAPGFRWAHVLLTAVQVIVGIGGALGVWSWSLALGLGALVGAVLSWHGHRYAGHVAVVLGLSLMLFMLLERGLGLQSGLQAFFFALGLAQLGLGGVLIRASSGYRLDSTLEERANTMPGDAYFENPSPARLVTTRAVSIAAPPEIVWPWLAQIGRGAGWYSFDRLDNGGRMSAKHILSWVPPPAVGDASAIGYLRALTPGEAMTWWVPGTAFVGATARLTVDIALRAEGDGSRLVIRMSADARGWTRWLALRINQLMETLMARRQLLGIKARAEKYAARPHDPRHPESGARDQYQLYEAIYAAGAQAGRRGAEAARRWHEAAVRAGLTQRLPPSSLGDRVPSASGGRARSTPSLHSSRHPGSS